MGAQKNGVQDFGERKKVECKSKWSAKGKGVQKFWESRLKSHVKFRGAQMEVDCNDFRTQKFKVVRKKKERKKLWCAK